MKKLDSHGAIGGKALLAMVVLLVIVLAYLGGFISLSLPSLATDKYSETVNRGATDLGMIVPIDIRVTFTQDADTGASKATINADVKHQHEALGSDNNYVPDATIIDSTDFNTKVGNVGDTSTVFGVNGVSFQASDIAYNATLTSLSTANYGYSQNNYKVWLKSGTAYSPALTADNSALLVQTTWKHYRKATGELLSADTVNWIIYYSMPDYNEDDSYTSSYRYDVYVPFDDYAVVEDIVVDIRGYFENCVTEWTTISTVTHEYWDFPMLNKFFDSHVAGSISLVRSRDTTLATAIQYSWVGPTDFSLNNDQEYGSHTYTYKIR